MENLNGRSSEVVKVAPSIFAADFWNLSDAVEKMKSAGVDAIHFDVMDNHFVPNISFGFKVVSDIMKRANVPADVHLMVELSNSNWKRFLELKPWSITLHIDAEGFSIRLLEEVKKAGSRVAVSLKPSFPVEFLREVRYFIDMVLIMTVDPGFSGQSFLPGSIDRIKKARDILPDSVSVQVDGGVNEGNFKDVIDAGADFLVLGSGFFKSKNQKELVEKIKSYGLKK